MSMPSGPSWFSRAFHGWSLAHYMIDGGFSMLLTLIGSKVLDLTPFEAVLLGGLSLITITGVIMVWVVYNDLKSMLSLVLRNAKRAITGNSGK